MLPVAVSGCAGPGNDPSHYNVLSLCTVACLSVCLLPALWAVLLTCFLERSTVNPEKFCSPVNTPGFFLPNFMKVLSSHTYFKCVHCYFKTLLLQLLFIILSVLFSYRPTFQSDACIASTSSYSSALKWK